MSASDKILKLIEKSKRTFAKVGKTSNLFLDLGFDSLAFVKLLVETEQLFDITFELAEMEGCLQVERLIDCVESKLGEKQNV